MMKDTKQKRKEKIEPAQQSKRCVGQGSSFFVLSSIKGEEEDWRGSYSTSMLGEEWKRERNKPNGKRERGKKTMETATELFFFPFFLFFLFVFFFSASFLCSTKWERRNSKIFSKSESSWIIHVRVSNNLKQHPLFNIVSFSILSLLILNFFCLLSRTLGSEWGGEMEETRKKREPWPTGLFDCYSGSILFSFLFSSFLLFLCFMFSYFVDDQNISLSFQFKITSFLFEKGGRSFCLWGFLCPFCLFYQGKKYSEDLFSSDPENTLMTESQFERYPPWSCDGIHCFDVTITLGLCCCNYGFLLGYERHVKGDNFEYYCSSQSCCCCDCGQDWCLSGDELSISIEDCLIGYLCCCCSLIQVTMSNEELFRMQSQVEGNVNIKHALRKTDSENKTGSTDNTDLFFSPTSEPVAADPRDFLLSLS